jgi:hypothetical protein
VSETKTAETVEARVVKRTRDGEPTVVEYGGRLWEPPHPQGAVRNDLREWELRAALEALAGGRWSEAHDLADELVNHVRGWEQDDQAALLRQIGCALVDAGAGALWRLVFYRCVVPAGYLWDDRLEPGAEWAALWGDTWREYLADPAPRLTEPGEGGVR